MGIASGEATVGPIDEGARLDCMAIGAVVNLAARLCQAADDGEVLVHPGAVAIVDDDTELRPTGTRSFKGIGEPIRVYALQG